MNGIKEGLCPAENFLALRLDMERSGYKILSADKVDDIQNLVRYTFIEVSKPIPIHEFKIRKVTDLTGDKKG